RSARAAMTPVLIWEIEDDQVASVVETDWKFRWTAEEFRGQAESLDRKLDDLLDQALSYARQHRHADATGTQFLRAWAVGKSLNESDVLESEPMTRERPDRLWKALAAKCRIGIRSTGESKPEWRELRP